MSWRSTVVAFAASLVVTATAAAQETGSMTGGVYDRAGKPIAGATVTIRGPAMPTPRITVTSEKGLFGFLVLPGEYEAVVEEQGVGRISRALVVSAARETRVDFILGALVVAPVAVTAPVVPDVDLNSSEVSFSYPRALLQDLPLDRTYMGLMQLIPGVAENGGFAPNAGGSRQDNTFLAGNVNITNPFFGYLSTEINELDIAEFDVKRGAIRAESGRSTGLLSNAVTRSGTNRFTGNYRFEAIPSQWIAPSAKVVKSRTNRWDHAYAVGGPAVENQLFYYASGRIRRSASPGASNLFGPLPSRDEETDEYHAKLTAQARSRHIVNAAFRARSTRIGSAGLGPSDAPSVASDVKGANRVARISYDWFGASRNTASVRVAYIEERNESRAVTDLGFQPAFNPNNPAAQGRFVLGGLTVGGAALSLNRQNYSRIDVSASLSRMFTTGRTSHEVKAGFGWEQGVEDLTRRSNGWGDISYVFVDGQQRVRATYYPEQPPQHSTGRTYSLFVQDDISPGPRLTLNVGLLLNRDEFVQAEIGPAAMTPRAFPPFGFLDQVQPRLGVNVQVRQGQGDKVFAHWGRYHGLDQKSSARAVASGRLRTEDADFDVISGALIEQSVSPNTGPKSIAPDLEPPFTDEIVIGYATPLSDGWTLDAYFQSRHSGHFIEDAPTVLPFSSFQFQNDPFAERRYRTVAVELRRRLRDQWAITLSYAWSRLTGNYDKDYAGDLASTVLFNTASPIDDGPGAFTSDRRLQSGVLSQDRTHVYKIMAIWVPKPIAGLSTGVFVRGQSGTPWEARGLSWDSGVTYLRFLEPAGTSRNPFWTNVDALVKYTLPVAAMRALHVEARILNVFNQETVLGVDQRKYLDPRNLTIVGTPTPGCWSCYTDAFPQGVSQVNTRFGQPVTYARPRRLLVSLLFDF